MTLDEVRKVLENAAWTRETPLVKLFDELVEHHDLPPESSLRDRPSKALIGGITATCAGLTQPNVSSGQIVAAVLDLRKKHGLNIYERGGEGALE